MTASPTSRYTGPLRAAVLDWAGTTIDFGCRAPAAVFRAAFAASGVEITEAEAREPMGLPKRDHIVAVGRILRVAEAWREVHGREMTDGDVDTVYRTFLPRQIEVVADYCDLIPGTLEAIAALRERGLAIGTTTGYTREIMAVCTEHAREQGYEPDAMACAGDTPKGRPGPYLLWRVLTQLDVYPPAAVVKIGDTPADVAEGLNAGTWVVAVAATGNETGLSRQQFEALSAGVREEIIGNARNKLTEAGAHYVVDGIADVPPVVDEIQNRLQRGERP